MTTAGILLVAHGSNVPEAEVEMRKLVHFLRTTTGMQTVEVGYLAYIAPSIQEAAKVCAAQKLTDLFVVPFFLSDGFLCKKALRLVREALGDSEVNLHVTEPLGGAPELIEAVLDGVRRADQTG